MPDNSIWEGTKHPNTSKFTLLYLVPIYQQTAYKFLKLNLTVCTLHIIYQTVALVGESGSGKSTAISLLQRFYDPDAGHILLDGVDIQKFQLRWLRQQMGLVSQEPSLFNDTIRANIAYGKEGEATESDVVAAARLANAHKFISSLHQVMPQLYYRILPTLKN